MFDGREFQDHHRLGLRRRIAGRRFHRKSAARRPAGRAGHFLSRALRRHQRERHRRRDAARAFPHRADARSIGLVRLVGRYRGAGLGHRRKPWRHADLPHHARQPSGLLHPFRRPHLCGLPGGAGIEAARWRDLAKHRHRGEIRRRPQPRAVPRQLQIQLARPELSRLPCRRAVFAQWDDHEVTNDWAPIGTADETGYAEDGSSLLVARARRAFHEFMPMRACPPRTAASIARSPMARCSTSS